MTTKTNAADQISLSMLQAESLLSMITAAGGNLILNKIAMRQFKRQGFNRYDLDGAIANLVQNGQIKATGTNAGVMLTLIKAAPAAAGK